MILLPITTIGVEEVVELTINSTTGRDALIFATIDERPEYQGVVKQQIDCVAPRTDNLVGYVKGEPYYGDFHVHPNTGKKMVGAAHTKKIGIKDIRNQWVLDYISMLIIRLRV